MTREGAKRRHRRERARDICRSKKSYLMGEAYQAASRLGQRSYLCAVCRMYHLTSQLEGRDNG